MLARLSAGLVILVATSRARMTYCGVRMERRSATSDSTVESEKRRATADFQLFDTSRPDRLIEPVPEDQGGDSGAQACGRGAGAPVVDDRAAGRKDGSVFHRVHNLDVVEMGDVSAIIRSSANQRPLA